MQRNSYEAIALRYFTHKQEKRTVCFILTLKDVAIETCEEFEFLPVEECYLITEEVARRLLKQLRDRCDRCLSMPDLEVNLQPFDED